MNAYKIRRNLARLGRDLHRSVRRAKKLSEPHLDKAVDLCRTVQGRLADRVPDRDEIAAIQSALKGSAEHWKAEASKHLQNGRERLARMSLGNRAKALRKAEEIEMWKREYREMRSEFLGTLEQARVHLEESREYFSRVDGFRDPIHSERVEREIDDLGSSEEIEREIEDLKRARETFPLNAKRAELW